MQKIHIHWSEGSFVCEGFITLTPESPFSEGEASLVKKELVESIGWAPADEVAIWVASANAELLGGVHLLALPWWAQEDINKEFW